MVDVTPLCPAIGQYSQTSLPGTQNDAIVGARRRGGRFVGHNSRFAGSQNSLRIDERAATPPRLAHSHRARPSLRLRQSVGAQRITWFSDGSRGLDQPRRLVRRPSGVPMSAVIARSHDHAGLSQRGGDVRRLRSERLQSRARKSTGNWGLASRLYEVYRTPCDVGYFLTETSDCLHKPQRMQYSIAASELCRVRQAVTRSTCGSTRR